MESQQTLLLKLFELRVLKSLKNQILMNLFTFQILINLFQEALTQNQEIDSLGYFQRA